MLDLNSVFNPSFYLAANPDVSQAVAIGAVANPLEHYVTHGQFEERQPSGLFDPIYYLGENPDVAMAVAESQFTTVEHYLTYGQFEGREPNPWFDTEYYVNEYPDVNADVESDELIGFKHYLEYGEKEGRDPNPWFDTSYYLEENADVSAAVENGELMAIEHYLLFGVTEGRLPVPDGAGNSLVESNDIGVLNSAENFIDWVGNFDPIDYYRLTIDAAKNFSLNLNAIGNEVDVKLVHDLNNNNQIDSEDLVYTSEMEDNGNQIIEKILQPGTFFVVISEGEENTRYTLNLSADIPTNLPGDGAGNSLNEALDLNNIEGDLTFNDSVNLYDLNDVYRLDLNSNAELSITLNNLTSNADLKLIQDLNNNGEIDSGEVLKSSLNSGNNSEKIAGNFPAGNYFVVVSSVEGSTSYNLGISALVESNRTENSTDDEFPELTDIPNINIPVVENTSNVGVEDELNDEATTESPVQEPTIDPTDEEITTDEWNDEPTTDVGEDEPSTDVGEDEPTTDAGEGEPTTELPDREPTIDPTEDEPTTDVGEDEPTTESPERETPTEVAEDNASNELPPVSETPVIPEAIGGEIPPEQISEDLVDLLSPTAGEETEADVNSDVVELNEEFTDFVNSGGDPANFEPIDPRLQVNNGLIAIEAFASGDPSTLLSDLQQLGLEDETISEEIIAGMLPITNIAQLDNLESLEFFELALEPIMNKGDVTSEGDISVDADWARYLHDIDGTGITVGVISDSFNNLGGLEYDIFTGDLPPTGFNLKDKRWGGTDEGRAMLQIIHDLAPGAELMFHTSGTSQFSMVQAIRNLADAGADIIVDDVSFMNEPMFQDGRVSQAINDVVYNQGISYFTAAGNNGETAYESFFNGVFSPVYGRYFHDFDPGPLVDTQQSISIPVGTVFKASFQWDSPARGAHRYSRGSDSDFDIFLLDRFGRRVHSFGGRDFNLGRNPMENIHFYNDPSKNWGTEFNIVIVHKGGERDGKFIKYVPFNFEGSINEYQSLNPYTNTPTGSIFGHANAQGAITVTAASYQETPFFNGGLSPVVQYEASAGPTQIFFNKFGDRLSFPETRFKPNVTAPDNVNNTFFGTDTDFDGWPNFTGTSAAAPHAAAVAALMMDADPTLRRDPLSLYQALQYTAIDTDDPATYAFDFGPDYGGGYGLINALLAVEAVIA